MTTIHIASTLDARTHINMHVYMPQHRSVTLRIAIYRQIRKHETVNIGVFRIHMLSLLIPQIGSKKRQKQKV